MGARGLGGGVEAEPVVEAAVARGAGGVVREEALAAALEGGGREARAVVGDLDDEAPARSELRFLLEQTGKIASIAEASSVRTAIEMLMENRVDVVFLDISMPGASGLQLAEALHKLKNPPSIVFVTAYSDHAVEAFDVDAVDYLLKPVEEARLDQAIEKVLARTKPQTESKVTIERIPVEKGGRKVLIPVDQIRYIMAKDDYSCIFTDDDRFLSTTSLAQFEAKLCDFGFFRVHRRYIVNLACVEDVETIPSGAIQLGITGMEDRVPVSRRRVVPLKKALSL